MITRDIIEKYLLDKGIDYKAKEERGEFYICSPFTGDSKFKCGINWKKTPPVFNCFKTGTKGNFITFVKILEGMETSREAIIFLFKNYMTKEEMVNFSNSFFADDIKKEKVEEPKEKLAFSEDYKKINIDDNSYYNYLIGRNFTDEIIKKSNIFYSPLEKRVVFPVYENGELIFFAKRAIDKHPLRWINSISHGVDPIWNLENVGETVYLFEGIFDAVRMWPNGVSIFGKNLSDGQLNKIIKKKFHKIVVVLDNDSYGRESQEKIAERLAERHKNVWINLWREDDKKDLSDMKNIELNLIKFDLKGKLLKKLNDKTLKG
jgi:5S rRNA maturation endonuclease (ribonuclease M5)